MKKEININELIDCKFHQFASKNAFLLFITIECERQHIICSGGAFAESFTSQYIYL